MLATPSHKCQFIGFIWHLLLWAVHGEESVAHLIWCSGLHDQQVGAFLGVLSLHLLLDLEPVLGNLNWHEYKWQHQGARLSSFHLKARLFLPNHLPGEHLWGWLVNQAFCVGFWGMYCLNDWIQTGCSVIRIMVTAMATWNVQWGACCYWCLPLPLRLRRNHYQINLHHTLPSIHLIPMMISLSLQRDLPNLIFGIPVHLSWNDLREIPLVIIHLMYSYFTKHYNLHRLRLETIHWKWFLLVPFTHLVFDYGLYFLCDQTYW